jgi:hypothetical protein
LAPLVALEPVDPLIWSELLCIVDLFFWFLLFIWSELNLSDLLWSLFSKWPRADRLDHTASNSSVCVLLRLRASTIHTLWRRSPATVVDTCWRLLTSNISQHCRTTACNEVVVKYPGTEQLTHGHLVAVASVTAVSRFSFPQKCSDPASQLT